MSIFFRGCDASCQRECLAAHNRYRLNHGASPLLLDQTLAEQAQRWADKKVFKHSPWAGGQGGETIALGSLYPTFTAAVKAWHDEERDYDWSTGTGNGDMKVNHFTQVWIKFLHIHFFSSRIKFAMQSLSICSEVALDSIIQLNPDQPWKFIYIFVFAGGLEGCTFAWLRQNFHQWRAILHCANGYPRSHSGRTGL